MDTLWPALHLYDPVEHPNRQKFVDRYCDVQTDFWGGITVGTLKPLMEPEFLSIFEPRSRRLPRQVVLPKLPPLVQTMRVVKMGKEQAAAYKAMAEHSIAELENGDVVLATSTAAQYTRMGQFASSYAYTEDRPVKDKQTGETVMKTFVELALPSCKIHAFLEDYQDWRAQEEAVIVAATSRRLINLLSQVLKNKKIPHSLVVGGQSDMVRYEQISAFQRGEVDLILVVTSAGGASITLTRGRIMAHLQRSWAKWEDEQMEGRNLRLGSEVHESILRVDYVTEGTVDVGQLDVLEAKGDIMQTVLRDKETIKRLILGGHLKPKETISAA